MPSRPAIQSFDRSRWLCRIGILAALILFLVPLCWAQIPPVSSTTMTPVPDVGHDYIHAPLETVNPVTGSVSIRIPVRLPSGRELTLPLSFAYDSSGVNYVARIHGVGNLVWLETTSTASQTGWSETVPISNVNEITWTTMNATTKITCHASVDYVFQDAEGNRHNLGLTMYSDPGGTGPCTINTADWPPGFEGQIVTQGGEGPILATIPSNWTGGSPPIVTDGSGTVYSWAGHASGTYMPANVTDRNGNAITINSTVSNNPTFSYVDTAGRTVLQDSGFALSPETLTVDGLSSPYTLTWTALSTPTFSTPITTLSGSCIAPTHGGWGSNQDHAVSSIALPNGKSFSFTYDSVYGLLNKMTYPTGGYVRYVWGMNYQAEFGYETDSNGIPRCDMRYAVPVITDRYVSFDGTHEVLHQQFAYSTTWDQTLLDQWDSKQTTVTTYDLVRGTNFNTIYTYSSRSVPNPPNTVDSPTNNVPVESSVASYDTNGALLRTVSKGWCNIRELCAVYTTLADTGQTSSVFNCYDINEQLTETDEYDFGASSQTSPACGGSIPFTGGPLLRTTKTTYANFSSAHIVDLPSSVITYDGSGNRVAETDSSYDQTTPQQQTPAPVQHNAAPGGSARGNLTTVTKDCFVGSTTCASGNSTTTYSYYDTGQIHQMSDPKLNLSTYSYTDSYSSCGGNAPPSGATNAYLTQVTYPQTNGVNHMESYCYDYSAGLLRGSTDENGQPLSYTYADSLDRLTQANYPDGGQTTVSYNDTPPTPSVTVQKKLNTAGQLVTSQTNTNGVGLTTETILTSDPQGADFTFTSYDGLGRAYQVYNPTRCNPPTTNCGESTWGFTTYAYDALSRTTSVTKPDNSFVTTVYSGNCTTVTDEAGKNRESCTDGLGRMTEVIEDTGQGHLNYITNYTYDALSNLLSVVQGGSRNRSFTYDSLKRLLTSTNPESGTVTYTYDANGNVTTKMDARGITTNYNPTNSPIDALNRVTGVTYSNGDPSVSYTYDQSACMGQSSCYNIGHRTTMSDVGGSENLAYDKMGRELVEQRTTNSVTKTTTYGYNLLGDITALTYPSGRTISYTYDSAGRPAEAQDIANNIKYAQGSCADGVDNVGACYAPMGAESQIQNGTNLFSTYLYNNRLQPCWFYATTGAALPTSTQCTASASAGNILDLKYNFNLGAADNGNVIGITNDRDSTRTQSFTYDALNRIATGKTSSASGSNCWGETYTIDQWGNLTNIGAVSGYTGCTQESLSVSPATANNQLPASSGYSYDAAGNMLTDNANTYTYNAESEIKAAAGVTYTYDGDGNRVYKSSGKIYWYGAGTEILDESDGSGNFTNEYVFFGGKRIAMRNVSSGTIYYYAEDMLGSSRTIVQAGQMTPCYDGDFYPFGGERTITNTCSQNYKFEGKERDTESGNDDFGARYYSSRLGRWLSADWSSVPVPVPYANLTNPQTLNLYAIVSDNPETFADLDGHQQDDEKVDPRVEEIENKELDSGLKKAASELTQQRSDATAAADAAAFTKALAAHPEGFDNPLTGACYAPSNTAPTMRSADSSNDKLGEIYVTEPQKSGKPYVGRTTQGVETRMARRTDGRGGTATSVDTYKNREEGRYKEQKTIDQRGGVSKLDNKRNEVNPEKMKELKKKHGD